jgi:hypothetical protein
VRGDGGRSENLVGASNNKKSFRILIFTFNSNTISKALVKVRAKGAGFFGISPPWNQILNKGSLYLFFYPAKSLFFSGFKYFFMLTVSFCILKNCHPMVSVVIGVHKFGQEFLTIGIF